MSEIVVCVAHFPPDLGWNITDDDSRYVTFTSSEVVAPEVLLSQNLLPRDHLLIACNSSRGNILRNFLTRFLLMIRRSIVIVIMFSIRRSRNVFAFLILRRWIMRIVELHWNLLLVVLWLSPCLMRLRRLLLILMNVFITLSLLLK